jgi:uncharacterized protein YbaR (Trm112 family)
LAIKLSTEEFIKSSSIKHNNVYTYDNSVYTSAHEKLLVTCLQHGDFLVAADAHKNGGRGCPKCKGPRLALVRKKSFDQFEKDARAIHGSVYDYTQVVYVNTKTLVNITCKIHGIFPQRPSDHIRGQGCPDCGSIFTGKNLALSVEEFVESSRKIHGETYDYSLVNYKNNSTPVDIICRVHGVFPQRPSGHVKGTGCPDCQTSGYRVTKPGIFYILQSSELLKVGITNRTAEIRCKKINKTSGKDFKVSMSLKFETGLPALQIENAILNLLRETHKSPEEVFDGSTECFYGVDYNKLISEVLTVVNQIK